ncbi:MAG: phosphotransferase [Dehalococcoidia bacterium]
MPRVSFALAETLRAVLERYSITPGAIRDIASGRMNRHWRIAAAGGREYVLRRYNTRRSRDSIAWEHALLAHAATRGLPVAEPLSARDRGRDRATLVEDGGSLYALFPLLPGHPSPYANLRYLRIKGRLLARLHHELATWHPPGQRDGYGRIWELDTLFDHTPHVSFNEALRAFGRDHRETASGVRAQRYRSLRELSRLGYGDLPDAPVHWDFHHDNLFFVRGELTALLDFDSAHLDARAADIAFSIALDCLEPPDHHAIDPRAVRAFVGGYLEHTPLDNRELRLIVPLVRAVIVWSGALALSHQEHFGERVARSLDRSVRFRYPALEARAPALEAAVHAAAEEAAARS